MEERFSTFTVLITKINRQIRRIKTEEMAEFDLKSPHVSCLYYLYKEEGLTAKELSDICDEDKGAISRSIEYLESCGYLVCDSTARKRYRARLCLSESGREIGKRICEKIDGVLGLVGRDMSDAERATLYRALGTISRDLQTITEQYENKKQRGYER